MIGLKSVKTGAAGEKSSRFVRRASSDFNIGSIERLEYWSKTLFLRYERKQNTVSQKWPFLPKFGHEILAHSVSLNVGPFRPIFLAKLKGMVLNCGIRKWLVTKLNFRDFLLYLHSKNLDFAFLLKRQLRLKIDLSTSNRKLSQMNPRWCGNTLVGYFRCFRPFFGWFCPHLR